MKYDIITSKYNKGAVNPTIVKPYKLNSGRAFEIGRTYHPQTTVFYLVIPPVPVVELGGSSQLQHIPDIGVEHVEQNVILVPVQFHGSQLFSG